MNSFSLLVDKFKKHQKLVIVLFLFALPVALYWKELTSNILMFNGDGYLVLSSSMLEKKVLLSGEIPLWNSYVVAGTPFLADPGNSLFYPLKLLLLVFPPELFAKLFYILSLGFGGLFSYLFFKEATKRNLVAVIAAVVFTTSTIIGGYRKEHVMVYSTIIWLPLILFFYIVMYEFNINGI